MKIIGTYLIYFSNTWNIIGIIYIANSCYFIGLLVGI